MLQSIQKLIKMYMMNMALLTSKTIGCIRFSNKGAIADMVERFNNDAYAHSYYRLEYIYLNEGMFSVATIYRVVNDDGSYTQHKYFGKGQTGSMFFLYNAESNKVISSGGEPMVTMFHDGFCLMLPNNINDRLLYKVSKNGEKTVLRPASGDTIGPVSEGMFFNGAFFYNLDGEVEIDLSEYRIIGKSYYFVDGKCDIYFLNPADKTYMMTIDTSGRIITEPSANTDYPYNSRSDNVFNQENNFNISFDSPNGWMTNRLYKTKGEARMGIGVYFDPTYLDSISSDQFIHELFFSADNPNLAFLNDIYLGSNCRYLSLELEKGKEYLLEFRGIKESRFVLLCIYSDPDNSSSDSIR